MITNNHQTNVEVQVRADEHMTRKYECVNCTDDEMTVFYEMANSPVLSVELLRSREDAINFPTGDIALGFCRTCGFITNVLYDPSLHDYSNEYESTQTYSPTFDTFAHRVARDLVGRYALYGKTILEIGCGQGEFLRLLCDLVRNWGVGFDPAYIEKDENHSTNGNVSFIKDYFSQKYADQKADLVVCKMTLEHIHKTSEFISMIRHAIGDRLDTTVFFQVPDVTRILRELAFWDVYYEHCSYFSPASLSYLFVKSGFEIQRLSKEYGDQYILLEAKPIIGAPSPVKGMEDSFRHLKRDVAYFSMYSKRRIREWRQSIRELRAQGKRIVLWGGGSKAVAFLTTLGIQDEIEYVVDINPKKDGTFIAGTGQQVVSPEFLREYKPETVFVMNPIYMAEIEGILKEMDLEPELIAV